MEDGLKLRVRGAYSGPVRGLLDELQVLFLAMKHQNPDAEEGSANRDGDDPRRSPKARSESDWKSESAFATVEKDGQCPGQHNAEEWYKSADEKAKETGLQGGANRGSPVHRVPRSAGPSLGPGPRRLYGNLRRKLVRRGFRVGGNFSFRNRHVNLRSPALRTKRPPVLNRGSTLLAGVFHVLKLAHNEPGEQARASGHRAIGPSGHLYPEVVAL